MLDQLKLETFRRFKFKRIESFEKNTIKRSKWPNISVKCSERIRINDKWGYFGWKYLVNESRQRDKYKKWKYLKSRFYQ